MVFSCRDVVRTLQRKKRSVIGRTRDWSLAASPTNPPPSAAASWAQRWRMPSMKPTLAPHRPHEPLMRLVAGSRAWHRASGGSVRGVATALLLSDEPKAWGPTTIHSSAVVDPGAVVGEGVTIGPYCVVGPHVSLCDGVHLHAHVHVAGHTRIEEETTVHSFASVGAAPQDRKYRGEPSALVVGRGCIIHNYAHLCGGTAAGGGATTIGEGCLIMSHCHVGHDSQLGDRVVLASNSSLAGHVHVGDDAQATPGHGACARACA